MKTKRFTVALFIMFLLCRTVQASGESANTDSPPGGTLPFSLTISGGISLGSYEAGVNWALIEYMKYLRDEEQFANRKPVLTAVTGASAGAINAVMTAMLWRIHNSELIKENVGDNIIRNAWVDVGIDQLLPKDISRYHNPNVDCRPDEFCQPDSIFSRRALEKSERMIRDLLELPVFNKEKSVVYIALLTTRERPEDIDMGGISVRNQRYVFMLQFVTDEKGYGHFESKKVDGVDSKLGTVAYLPQTRQTDGSFRVEFSDIMRLIYASSAFPIAFGKVNINHCVETAKGRAPSNFTGECPEGQVKSSADFIDGGVFDNVPLGATLSLVKQFGIEKENYFFFISPSNRRKEMACEPKPEPQKTFGLEGMLAFVPGYMSATSDHELFTVLRGGQWQSYRYAGCSGDTMKLVVTDRFFPVTGAFLGHFGAFLDLPFREFDYYAGVYDAVDNMARFTKCISQHMVDEEADARWARPAYEKLGLDNNDASTEVFRGLAEVEHGPVWGAEWISSARNVVMSRLLTGIKETLKERQYKYSRGGQGDNVCDDSNQIFTKFIKKLQASDYLTATDDHSETMTWIMMNPDKDYRVWYSKLAGRAGMRLQDLQSFEDNAIKNNSAQTRERQKGGLGFIAGGISLAAGRFFDKGDDVSFQPHSIPAEESASHKFYYNLVPYEIATDTASGGLLISYVGRMTFKHIPVGSGIELKLTPVGYNKFGDSRVFYSQADLYVSVNRVKSVLTLGAGPTLNYLWERADDRKRVNVGAAAFVEVFHTLRFTAGIRDLGEHKILGHNYYVTLGLVDLPGLLYRVFR